MSPISIVAAVILDEAGRVLLVRKRDTQYFMLPGGKPAIDESELSALERELVEELGCPLLDEPRLLGRFEAPAANEPGCRVEASVYLASLAGQPTACAEIDALRWHHPDLDTLSFPLAPLALEQVLPALQAFWRVA